jgi:ParB family chromosome partitioning protein
MEMESGQESVGRISEIPVEEICLNPSQPRKKIEDDRIQELADSIKQHGLLQPVIVTRKDGLFHLVVGERRLRAVKELGMPSIPAIIKEYTWDDMLKVALVENLQREDLNPVEEARAYRMLINEHNQTQEQVAEAIGKSRPYVANIVRLLNLPQEILEDLETGDLSIGHARALLGLETELQILKAAARIKKYDLSVRQTEELVKSMKEGEEEKRRQYNESSNAFNYVENRLAERFSAKVTIKNGKGNKGRIEIHYASMDELNRLVSALGGDEEWI